MHNNSYTFSDAWNYDECLNVHYKCKWNRNWRLGIYYIIGVHWSSPMLFNRKNG